MGESPPKCSHIHYAPKSTHPVTHRFHTLYTFRFLETQYQSKKHDQIYFPWIGFALAPYESLMRLTLKQRHMVLKRVRCFAAAKTGTLSTFCTPRYPSSQNIHYTFVVYG